MMVLPSTTVRLVPEGQRAGNAPGRRGGGRSAKTLIVPSIFSLSPLSARTRGTALKSPSVAEAARGTFGRSGTGGTRQWPGPEDQRPQKMRPQLARKEWIVELHPASLPPLPPPHTP